MSARGALGYVDDLGYSWHSGCMSMKPTSSYFPIYGGSIPHGGDICESCGHAIDPRMVATNEASAAVESARLTAMRRVAERSYVEGCGDALRPRGQRNGIDRSTRWAIRTEMERAGASAAARQREMLDFDNEA